MEAVYKLHFDCGRQGELTGLFVAKKEKVRKLIDSGIKISFGEVLGKHSDVCGPIEQGDISMVSDDENVVNVIKDNDLENGVNPFKYYSYTLDEYEDMLADEIIDKLLEKEKAG